jgi:hypothetical protein
MHSGGSGSHHRSRCLALKDAPLQHPGSWDGLEHLLRATGFHARRPSAAAHGRSQRLPRLLVDEWIGPGTPRRPQERLRSRPGRLCLVCVEQESVWVVGFVGVGGNSCMPATPFAKAGMSRASRRSRPRRAIWTRCTRGSRRALSAPSRGAGRWSISRACSARPSARTAGN